MLQIFFKQNFSGFIASFNCIFFSLLSNAAHGNETVRSQACHVPLSKFTGIAQM